MAWVALVIAGQFEVGWATAMKLSEGFLSFSMRFLPLGTAYGAWTGIGAVGSVLVGIFFLGESRDPLRLLFVALILVGIVGLRLTTQE